MLRGCIIPAKNLEDIKVDVIVTNIELVISVRDQLSLQSMRWNCNPRVGMKVTFWLSRNNSKVQEFSLLIGYVYGENIKLYVAVASNKRKDISFLE